MGVRCADCAILGFAELLNGYYLMYIRLFLKTSGPQGRNQARRVVIELKVFLVTLLIESRLIIASICAVMFIIDVTVLVVTMCVIKMACPGLYHEWGLIRGSDQFSRSTSKLKSQTSITSRGFSFL